MKKLLCITLCVIMTLSLFSVGVSATAPIECVDMCGIVAPVVGDCPSTAFFECTCPSVKWTEACWKYKDACGKWKMMIAGEKFKEGVEYAFFVTVAALQKCQFDKNCAFFINGCKAACEPCKTGFCVYFPFCKLKPGCPWKVKGFTPSPYIPVASFDPYLWYFPQYPVFPVRPSVPSFPLYPIYPTYPTYTKPVYPTYTKPVYPTYTKPSYPTYTKPSYPTYTKPSYPTYTKPSCPTYTKPSCPTCPTDPQVTTTTTMEVTTTIAEVTTTTEAEITTTTVPTQPATTTTSNTPDNPKEGNTGDVTLLVLLLAVAGGAIALMIVAQKKRA